MNIETIRNEREEEAKYILGMQFKMEMVVYTQDSKYITEIRNKIAQEGQAKGQLYTRGMTSKEMMKHFEVYYKVNVTQILFLMFSFKACDSLDPCASQ